MTYRDVGTLFHDQHGTSSTPSFLFADGEASWSPVLIIIQHSATRKHVFLYSQGDRSGLTIRIPSLFKEGGGGG